MEAEKQHKQTVEIMLRCLGMKGEGDFAGAKNWDGRTALESHSFLGTWSYCAAAY